MNPPYAVTPLLRCYIDLEVILLDERSQGRDRRPAFLTAALLGMPLAAAQIARARHRVLRHAGRTPSGPRNRNAIKFARCRHPGEGRDPEIGPTALDSGPGEARFILSLSKGRNDAK